MNTILLILGMVLLSAVPLAWVFTRHNKPLLPSRMETPRIIHQVTLSCVESQGICVVALKLFNFNHKAVEITLDCSDDRVFVPPGTSTIVVTSTRSPCAISGVK